MNIIKRLEELEERQQTKKPVNTWIINVIDSSGEVVECYHYPSKEKVADEY
jgi:hypothetical protein